VGCHQGIIVHLYILAFQDAAPLDLVLLKIVD